MNKLILIIIFTLIPSMLMAKAPSNNFALYYKNRNDAVNNCKNHPDKPYVLSAFLMYKSNGQKYHGLTIAVDVHTCEDIPEHSICIDNHHCLIKYEVE